MEMENSRSLPLDRETVWEALNDPALLQACIPGCESFDEVEQNTYDAVVNTKVGPVKARFKGRVTLADLQPPESYSMSFQGQGGQAGFVKGSASVRLDAEDGGCRLGYSVKATLGGKLAQLGSRLIDGAAQKTANQFFDNFVEHMGGDGQAESAGPAAGADAGTGAGEAQAMSAAGPAAVSAGPLTRALPWVIAAVILAAVALTFL